MNNSPAFPWCGDLNDCPTINLGMTLRDYFAAKAMQGASTGCASRGEVGLYSDWAGFAYEMADAMMEARGK